MSDFENFKTNQEITNAIEKVKLLYGTNLPELVCNLSTENGFYSFAKQHGYPDEYSEWETVKNESNEIFTIMKHESGKRIAVFNFSSLASVFPEFKNVVSFRMRHSKIYGAKFENDTVYTSSDRIIYYSNQEELEDLKELMKVDQIRSKQWDHFTSIKDNLKLNQEPVEVGVIVADEMLNSLPPLYQSGYSFITSEPIRHIGNKPVNYIFLVDGDKARVSITDKRTIQEFLNR